MLQDLGLTQNQARVYLSTARIGPATITEIAKHSKVRREEIYRLLPDLEKIGLVERMLGKPMRIRTPDVKSAMSTLLQHERSKAQERISKLTEKTDMIEEYLAEAGLDVSVQSDVDDDFALLAEKESIRTRVHEMVNNSKSTIDVIYSRQNIVWFLSSQSQLLIEAAKRNVRIRLLSNPTTGKDRIPKIIDRRFPDTSMVELKYITEIPTNYITIDNKVALIITSLKHQPNAHNLYTTNENLVTLVQKIFEMSWNESAYWKTSEEIMITDQPQTIPDHLGQPRNILCVYLTNKRKEKVITKLMKENFENNKSVLYLCPTSDFNGIKGHLKSSGVDVDTKLNSGEFQLEDVNAFFIDGDSFIIERAVDRLDEIYFHNHEKGFNGVVVIIDTEFLFNNKMTDSITRFEEEISKIIDANLTVMCVYDENSILQTQDPIGLFTKICIHHDKILTERD